jgi:hypothetical protein
MSVADAWRMRLRAALTAAMKTRDTDAVSALRGAIAAIDNAEAVAVAASGPDDAGAAAGGGGSVAGATAGVGSTEVARRNLTPNEVNALVWDQIADHERAAEWAATATHGKQERAERLLRQAAVLRSFVDEASESESSGRARVGRE